MNCRKITLEGICQERRPIRVCRNIRLIKLEATGWRAVRPYAYIKEPKSKPINASWL